MSSIVNIHNNGVFSIRPGKCLYQRVLNSDKSSYTDTLPPIQFQYIYIKNLIRFFQQLASRFCHSLRYEVKVPTSEVLNNKVGLTSLWIWARGRRSRLSRGLQLP